MAKVLAIFAVIILHVSASIVVSVEEIDSSIWIVGNIYDSFVRWCVPVFVMLSGALLLNPAKEETTLVFYKKRISRILTPLFFWSLFYLVWRYIKGTAKGNDVEVGILVDSLVSGVPYFHMWFLYMIIGLYLVTPFLRKIIVNSTQNEKVLLVILLFGLSVVNFAYDHFMQSKNSLFINLFLFYLPYFIVGHLICETRKEPSNRLLIFIYLLTTTTTAAFCYLFAISNGLGSGLYFYGYLSITVIPMSISVMFLLKGVNFISVKPEFTRETSRLIFGVYLIHPVFMEVFSHIGVSWKLFNPALSVPVIASVIFISSLVTSKIISLVPYFRRVI